MIYSVRIPSSSTVRFYSTKDLKDAFTYCVQVVRTRDFENYVWCTQLSKDVRPGIFALRAFHVETASVPERAGDGLFGSMRYQWWIDAIGNLYKQQPPANPIFTALAVVLASRHLTRYRLKKIVETRQSDSLREQPFEKMSELEDYAEGTAVQLLHLQLEAAGVDENDRKAQEAASLIGRAAALTNILRGTAHHATKGRLYFPIDLIQKHNVSTATVLNKKSTDGVKQITRFLADRALDYIAEARALRGEFTTARAKSVLMPATVAEVYLKALRRYKYDLFDPKLQRHADSLMLLKLQLLVKCKTWAGLF